MNDPATTTPATKQPANENQAMLAPNREEIRKFLNSFRQPAGWTIGALGNNMSTARFDDLDSAADYALMQNRSGKNIYHIPANIRVPFISSKPPRVEDIESSSFLWVDIDAQGEGDVQAEKERILRQVTGGLPSGIPEPTGIVSTGNGAQLYWKLSEAITPTEVVAKCKWLIQKLDGDQSAHNPNRLLRVPGTINYPTPAKLAKGRKRQSALLVSWDETLVYTPSLFPSAEAVQASISPEEHIHDLHTARLSSIDFDHLPLTGELRALIVTGDDSFDANRFKSRSEGVWHAVREMVKARLDDQSIYAIITDPNFGISAHVLNQSNPDRAARRTIQRARQSVENPALAEMNAKHAVIAYVGGKCMVTVEVPSPSDPSIKLLQLQSISEFRQAYANKYVETKDGPVAIGKWWLAQTQRRQYDTLVFRPGEPEEIGKSLNLWTGFATDPQPGDWSKFRQHIVEVLADGNEEHADYILRWVAWMVQNPGRRAEVALVLKGGKGTGKGTFGAALKAIFGRHGIQVSSAKQVAGDFNAHLRSVVFLFADEAYFAGSKADEGTLKRMLTEETLFIEAKGRDGEEVPNCLHVLMASNNDWVVPASLDERRFAVFDVSSKHAQDAAYFGEISAELANGGLAAFLFDVLAMDLGDWHPRCIPRTEALLEQKVSSLTPIQEWIYSLLQEGRLPCSTSERPDFAISTNLYVNARHTNPRLRDVSDIKLGKALKEFGVSDGWSGNSRGKKFPPLPDMRAAFEKRIGGHIVWGKTKADGHWDADAPCLNGVPF